MQSQCPHCCSSFDIPESALAAAEGIVRCGQCMQLFNAVEHEVELAESEASTDAENEAAILDTDISTPPKIESNTELDSELNSALEQSNPELRNDELNEPLGALSSAAALQGDSTEPLTAPAIDQHVDPENTDSSYDSASDLEPTNASSTLINGAESEPLADIPSLESYHDAIAEAEEDAEETKEPNGPLSSEAQYLAGAEDLEIPEFAASDFAATNLQQHDETADQTNFNRSVENPAEAPIEESADGDTFLFENDVETEEPPLFTPDSSALANLSARADDDAELLSLEESPAIDDDTLAPLTELREDRGPQSQRGSAKTGKTILAVSAAMVLCVGLAVQWLAATGKYTLLPPQVSDTLFSKVCKVIYCDGHDVQLAYESLEFLMHSHPETPNALLLKTTLINAGNEPLPFPHLLLEFSNLDNELLARREFKPEEYLGQDLLQSNNLLNNNTPVEIQLELADPGSEAVNYTIHYFLPTS